MQGWSEPHREGYPPGVSPLPPAAAPMHGQWAGPMRAVGGPGQGPWGENGRLGAEEGGNGLHACMQAQPMHSHVDMTVGEGNQAWREQQLVQVVVRGPGYKVLAVQEPAGFELLMLAPGFTQEEVAVRAWDEGLLLVHASPLDPIQAELWSMQAIHTLIKLPSRIKARSAQALMTLHGQLYVRVDVGDSNSCGTGTPVEEPTLELF
ncbi:hypothetical protein V8C86DRAFT_2684172 [Haematococcus lacustris]